MVLDVNGLCSPEFKQWPSGHVGDKFSPIFRLLRIKFYKKEELEENSIYSFNFLINKKHQIKNSIGFSKSKVLIGETIPLSLPFHIPEA